MTPQLLKAAQKAYSQCDSCRKNIETLIQIAEVDPRLRADVEELESKQEFLDKLCQTIIKVASSA